ncbi:hypothetical protein P5E99_15630 [Clostridium perfringens]|uniref:hypothetical protein n=1 Tax=Clostridium perfringens TaxID=1502 RepID=UPI001107019A|nr:hypothetical protein [Clostridium perfringens]MDK0610354.1 hypothetical protein [Clostridium perfringens]MDK0675360.1 hypothetical protein [Clostridium perfringens]MDM0609251.1 hypothetical protein [Clostridium perfringens]MDM0758001.1 hypothetical protein [Clostridium perfringens]MDM0761035.1 hypothetical protein [Clostridium perfringens]
MMISHSRKGFKRAEEVQAFLTKNAGISKEKVILEMLRRFKLGYSEANKIYMEWRKKYVVGEIKDITYTKNDIQNNLELYAERYAETNKKGYTVKEIIKIIKNINKFGIKDAAAVLDIDIRDITTVYTNAKAWGVIKPLGRKRRC